MLIFRPLFLFLVSAGFLVAQPPAAAPTAPAAVSTVESAWWTQLHQDIAKIRAANIEAGIRSLPLEATPENLSAIAARLEGFLDRRDKDPIAELGPEFQAYRKRLTELVDLALTPVTAAAKFKSTLVTDGMQRMATALQIYKQVESVDDYKPQLITLHNQLNARIVAGGGAPVFFFQTLGIGDSPRAPGTLATPAERDAQFLADSKLIHPVLAELVTPNFIEPRKKMGMSGNSMMEELRKTFTTFRERFSDASVNDLKGVLAQQPAAKPDGSFNLPRRLIQLELFRRESPVAYAIALQEWQGAFARWTGKGSDLVALGLCTDMAVAVDGTWFAYAGAEQMVVVRERAGGLRQRIATTEPIRALAATRESLLIFTTAGIFSTPVNGTPKLTRRADRKSNFIAGRIASARDIDRQVYGLGVMPAVVNGGSETTFSVASAASRITAVAASGDGRRFAYGYGGDNLTGNGSPRYGFDVLEFEPGPISLTEGTAFKVKSGAADLRLANTALSLDQRGDRAAAAWFGRFGGLITLHDFTGEKPIRTVISADGQPYQWIHLIEGAASRVVAATSEGVVRVWDAAEPHALLQRFEVPTGSAGVGYALLGDELVSVALGTAAVHRWRLGDGAHVATHEGTKPAVADAAALTARLAAERANAAAVKGPLLELLAAEDDAAKLKVLTQLRGPLATALEFSGQKPTVDYWFATLRYSEIKDLIKNNRDREGFELGFKEINAGLLDPDLLEITIQAGNYAVGAAKPDEALRTRLIALAERAASLHPSHVRIQREYLRAKLYQHESAGRVAAALKTVDELDLIESSNAPHPELRAFIFMGAYHKADKAGNKRAAMNYLFEALPYEKDKPRQLTLAQNAFTLAVGLKDWPNAVKAANMSLSLDPKLKDKQDFMYWARHAYAQVNPASGKAAPATKKK